MDGKALLAEIERFKERVKMTDTAIGRGAVRDPRFVGELRNGRRCWPETVKRVLAFMEWARLAVCSPDGTWLARDPETALIGTGTNIEDAVTDLQRQLAERKVAA